MRAPLLAVVVAGLHVVAVGSFLVIQGCGTPKQATVEPPPPPVMPPRQDLTPPGTMPMPKPAFQPPAVEKAPASLEDASSPVYYVQSGDSLSKIASKVGVTAREIAELNGIKDPNKIKLGQKLVLPSYAQAVPASASKPAAAPAPVKKPAAKAASAPAVAGTDVYTVRSGDSLSKVAVKNGTTVKALREVNNLKSDMIRIGQKLKLPAGSAKKADAAPAAQPAAPSAPAATVAPAAPAAVESAAPAPVEPAPAPAPASETTVITPASTTIEALAPAEVPFEYTIKAEDTLEAVAITFGVTSQQILDANGLTAGDIATGKKIKIPMPAP